MGKDANSAPKNELYLPSSDIVRIRIRLIIIFII